VPKTLLDSDLVGHVRISTLGELTGLGKSDVDLNDATVSIEHYVVEVGRGMVVKEPKTAAGVRMIALPRSWMPEIAVI
jgi:hypothetical protein